MKRMTWALKDIESITTSSSREQMINLFHSRSVKSRSLNRSAIYNKVMRIRLATTSDKTQVLLLLDELGEEINVKLSNSSRNTEAKKLGGPLFEEIVRRNDTMIFVAEENRKIVGLISLYLLPNMRHGYQRGHIEDIVVARDRRRKGIGTRLIEAVKNYCRKNGIRVIKLDSASALTDAHRFYEKMGGKFTEKMFRFDL